MDNVKDLTQSKEIAEHVCRMISGRMQMQNIHFAEGGVPVEVAARVMGKDATYVRQGIEDGWLPIGTMKPPETKDGRRNFYISPKLFWEFTGFIWGAEEMETKTR